MKLATLLNQPDLSSSGGCACAFLSQLWSKMRRCTLASSPHATSAGKREKKEWCKEGAGHRRKGGAGLGAGLLPSRGGGEREGERKTLAARERSPPIGDCRLFPGQKQRGGGFLQEEGAEQRGTPPPCILPCRQAGGFSPRACCFQWLPPPLS